MFHNKKLLKKNFKTIISVVVFLAALSSIWITDFKPTTLNSAFFSQILGMVSTAPEGFYQVESVVDGDTFKIRHDNKLVTVRLVGIDTPETKDPRKQVQCFGKEATQKLHSLLNHQLVRLEFDSLQGEKDRYGRTLAYVYLSNNTFVNEEMVKQGFAFAYTAIESDQLEYFKQLENLARNQNLGLWSQCPIK